MRLKIEKYQNKLSAIGNWSIYPKPQRKFKFCIVVPCYSESNIISNLLDSILLQNKKLLKEMAVIIVVNNSVDASNKIVNDNFKTIDIIAGYRSKLNIYYIDAFSERYALSKKKSGVGFSRKLGVDKFIPYLFKDSLICFTDADVILDPSYLTEINNFHARTRCSGFLVGFKHQKSSDQLINKYIVEYEKYLKDTAKSIKDAGSIYGYVSIGSCMGCTFEAYIAVGGMPAMKATEDFYFLQALSKYQKIMHIEKEIVFPSSRNELRVHLGTGFRINQLLNGLDIKDLYYSKKSYDFLKSVLSVLNLSWYDSIEETSKKLRCISNDILIFFQNENFAEYLIKIKNNVSTEDQYINQINRWFDGLKTIQFLNFFSNKN
tara:strand:- start:160 stop:1287 length:1128 start_codon:yes stop_codon:yes gene_type:complete